MEVTPDASTNNEKLKETLIKPRRRKMLDERQAVIHKFSIAGHEGYIIAGMFEDGSLGEIFVIMAKEGSTLSGLMDSFSMSISIALQYGIPLEYLIEKFSLSRYEPSGITTSRYPELRFANSITDYLFKWLKLKFVDNKMVIAKKLTKKQKEHFKKKWVELSKEEPPRAMVINSKPEELEKSEESTKPEELIQAQSDAPFCKDCGAQTIRSGSCYKCANCGETSGCS